MYLAVNTGKRADYPIRTSSVSISISISIYLNSSFAWENYTTSRRYLKANYTPNFPAT